MAGMTQKNHSITTSQLYFHCGPSEKRRSKKALEIMRKKYFKTDKSIIFSLNNNNKVTEKKEPLGYICEGMTRAVRVI